MEPITLADQEPKPDQKPKYYNAAVKRAIAKYRSKDICKYNTGQRAYYELRKQNPEWVIKFNERCRLNNQKYSAIKKEQQIAEGSYIEPKPKGRPRKQPFIDITQII